MSGLQTSESTRSQGVWGKLFPRNKKDTIGGIVAFHVLSGIVAVHVKVRDIDIHYH